MNVELSLDDVALSDLELQSAITERRSAIRYHRDQKGDDRCWLDDYLVWKFLPDSPAAPTVLNNYEELMRQCTDFYTYRRSETVDAESKNVPLKQTDWDNDLTTAEHDVLANELARLQQAIYEHCHITNRPRTLDDDRKLYLILPEKLPADFRLPPREEFLDGIKPDSGCPNFWNSHKTCPCATHDFRRWGPCCKDRGAS